ncbi:hypothetical protein MRB53_037022 [Persea americana]|nr:hypothetical protein MRB53_037022 [Persea americana]
MPQQPVILRRCCRAELAAHWWLRLESTRRVFVVFDARVSGMDTVELVVRVEKLSTGHTLHVMRECVLETHSHAAGRARPCWTGGQRPDEWASQGDKRSESVELGVERCELQQCSRGLKKPRGVRDALSASTLHSAATGTSGVAAAAPVVDAVSE